jgi:GT2 family glycosyltransferase
MIDRLSIHPEVGLLGCMMRYPEGGVQELGLQWFPTPWTILLEVLLPTGWKRGWLRRWLPVVDPNRSAYVRKLYGGCMLARREVLDAVGWFDERYFMYAEDVDLSRSVGDLGWKLLYMAEAEIVHESGGTSAKAPSGFSVLMKAQSINQMIRKYQGRCASLLYRGALLLGSGFRLLGLGTLRVIRPAGLGPSQKQSIAKQKLIVLWALGLKHPTIPQRKRQPELAGGVEAVQARG